MAQSKFESINVLGIAAAVPRQRIDNLNDHTFLSEKERKNIIKLTGIDGYRKVPDHICTSDLCAAAAEKLFENLDLDRNTIDALVFVTMTPDYVIPSTACLLQHRLGLSTDTVSFDVNMGCSGYIVGLYNAAMLINGGRLNRVLLLAGDTQSKLCYEKDKNVVFLMGDGGTATLLENDETQKQPLTISIQTDGSRFDKLYVPAGGFRNPSSEQTREVVEQKDGGMRSKEHIYMDGMEIFKFSTTDVVKSMKAFMLQQQISADDIDHLVLHQANKFMTDKVAKKLNVPLEKVPYSLHNFGNTGSASIPLTIACHGEAIKNDDDVRCLLAGFGVGLSWGVADITLHRPEIPSLVEI